VRTATVSLVRNRSSLCMAIQDGLREIPCYDSGGKSGRGLGVMVGQRFSTSELPSYPGCKEVGPGMNYLPNGARISV